jgi:hypothetical protein
MLKDTRHITVKGLTAFQIKIIALVCMTIDHIAAYGYEIPIVSRYATYFRAVGRIAAPLFLFILVQSIRHTRSKPKFVLRLYIAGMCVELFDTAMNFFFGEIFGYHTPGNIMFTFFYTALYVVLIEQFVHSCQERNLRSVLLITFGFILSLVPSIFFTAIYNAIPVGASMAYRLLFQGLRTSFIPSFYDVDYGIGLILLGVLLYFAKTKWRQCLTFAIFCLFCIGGAYVGLQHTDIYFISFFGFTSIFFDLFQCRMIFALPFLMLYNGKQGRKCKWFFYWYYPIHRQLIIILSSLVT